MKESSYYFKLKKKMFKKFKKKDIIPTCFGGMCWTLNTFILFYYEQNNVGLTYILTGYLILDVIKNIFSVFRQRRE